MSMNMESPRKVKPDHEIRPLDASLPIQLLAAHDAVMGYFRPMLNRFEMTDQQWRVLRTIAARGSVDFRALGEATLIQPASLSRMLDGMESRGWITRTAGRDRRQRTVTMTETGGILFADAAAETEAIYARLEADLGPAYASAIGALNAIVKRVSTK